MKISPNTVVTVNYHLHAGLPNEAKQHVESTETEHPFRFLFGVGGLIAGFEKNLSGLEEGAKFDFKISPEEGYGASSDEAIVNLPIDIFKVEGAIDFSVLKTGNTLPMSDDQGNTMTGKVVSFNNEFVTMDFNHPLAGHELHFSGEVLNVRVATQEEIAHRHVH